MMIKILDKDSHPICVYDGSKWVGNLSCLPKAIELMAGVLKDYKARKIIESLMGPAKPPPTKLAE
jgi:hypothetical protein